MPIRNMTRTALVTGVLGQGGGYLARQLLESGYEVIGTSRDSRHLHSHNLVHHGIEHAIDVISIDIANPEQVRELVDEYRPREIYHLASPSSVWRSFQEPVETYRGVCAGTVNLLEAVRRVDPEIRFFHAGSSEMFGDCEVPATEDSALDPRSPYAAAKAAAYLQVRQYRLAYGLHASTAVYFNFESPFRPHNYVTRKVVSTAYRISRGEKVVLKLGHIDIHRDWGWAPEYMGAAIRMLARDKPGDLVIATGRVNSLRSFVEKTFGKLGLDYEEHVQIDGSLFRPSDVSRSHGNARRAWEKLGWRAVTQLDEIIDRMIEGEERAASSRTTGMVGSVVSFGGGS